MTTSAANDYFDIDKFQQLLTKLEASKIKQLGEQATEDRRGTFAKGLASMMSNF